MHTNPVASSGTMKICELTRDNNNRMPTTTTTIDSPTAISLGDWTRVLSCKIDEAESSGRKLRLKT